MALLKNRLFVGFLGLVFVGVLSAGGTYLYLKHTLPKLFSVADYEPLLVSKVYDRKGKILGQFFKERRTLIDYKDIPKNLINAFLAAEDDQFFKHKGINYFAIFRAGVANLLAGHTVQGGSTITQQVAKTFFLSNEKKIIRKLREAILAIELENHLSKEDILYLYLNQIYFGQGAYGISTAAETYFRKPVKDLDLSEMAILAGLPKAPSEYSPIKNPSRAKERQVYVLNRMVEVGYIPKAQADKAAATPINVYFREKFEEQAPFALETIRQLLVQKIGEDLILEKGVQIHTSLDLKAQLAAQESLRKGLKEVDKRQGFRGAKDHFTDPQKVGNFLLEVRDNLIAQKIPERTILPTGQFKDYGPLNIAYDLKTAGLPFYLALEQEADAIVSKVDDELGLVFVKLAEIEGIIDLETMDWARPPNTNKRYDLDTIKKPSEALKVGDIIAVKLVAPTFSPTSRIQKLLTAKPAKGKAAAPVATVDWAKYAEVELEQEPLVESALISFDQQSQQVIALVGGYDFKRSKYNRALQALRQTGSAFKSIVYSAALDKGYTPSTPIMDAPIVFEEEDNEGQDAKTVTASKDDKDQKGTKVWRPDNHGKSFSGDIIFRDALVKSLNIPTVKIIEEVKVPYVVDYAQRLGIFSPLNPDFTLALGSSSVTLYEMTKTFSVFGRQGKRIRPVIIGKVLDRTGKKLSDEIGLDARFENELNTLESNFEQRRLAFLEDLKKTIKTPEEQEKERKTKIEPNIFFEDPDQLIRPSTAYLTTSLLKAVVEDKSGTGQRAKALGREVAGKTGTTNGYIDAWFIGYTQQVATGVWVGFDQEKSIGKGEVGGRAALPIWVEYMKVVHEDLPQMTFPAPSGIVFANIDAETGTLASTGSKSIVRQAYLEGTEPSSSRDRKEEDTDFYKQDLTE
jgi:penicillin-binding protein 1A